MPVRESELVCANCGTHLDARLRDEGGPRLPEERRLRTRARRVVVRPAQATARILSLSFACRALGMALMVIAIARGLIAAQGYQAALMPDESLLAFYAIVLWSVVGVAGFILLMVGVFVLRPGG